MMANIPNAAQEASSSGHENSVTLHQPDIIGKKKSHSHLEALPTELLASVVAAVASIHV